MSYSLDSRNEKVQLDYNDLLISTPVTFTKIVSGYTWPRVVSFGTDPTAVDADVLVNPFLYPTPPFVQFENFSTLEPSLPVSNYIQYGVSGIFIVKSPGFYGISLRIDLGSPASGGTEYRIFIQTRQDVTILDWITVKDITQITGSSSGNFLWSTLSIDANWIFNGTESQVRWGFVSSNPNLISPSFSFYKLT